MKLKQLDRKIINRLCEELPDSLTPYRDVAKGSGLSEDLLLKRLRSYKTAGVLRRIAAILKHTDIGYKANCMAVWAVPNKDSARVGRIFANHSAVTHCYQRATYPFWKYSLYTMLHAKDKAACIKIVKELSLKSKARDYKLLFSVKEFKKTGMVYFG
ncbi:MAG: Lrp/AsnC family transcriptional regulator [Candidatus Omnitrophica bacterium]|nr:Lrp/AsnC family transcriptional regulator [Candidatus Omnitrophota bacterium]